MEKQLPSQYRRRPGRAFVHISDMFTPSGHAPAPPPGLSQSQLGVAYRIVNIRLKVNLGDQLAPAMIFAPPP